MHNDIFNSILKKSKKSKKIFLIDQNRTYKDFYNKTKQFQSFLRNNTKKQSVISICSNYSLNFVSLIFAAYLNKNIITIINPNASQKEKLYIIRNSEAHLVFYEKNLIEKKNEKNSYLGLKYLKFKKKINKELKLDDRFIIYTSGTTNQPKGAIITNQAMSANVIAISKDIKLKKNDRCIIFSPPSYAMAISQILTYMNSECSIILHRNGLRFPPALIEKINKYKISILNISISAYRILKKFIKNNRKFSSVRITMSAGMPMNTLIASQFKKFFPKSRIINCYGCTENSPRISHYTIPKSLNGIKNNFPVGKPLDGIKIKIKNKYNSKTGNIFISGTSLMRGYLKNKILNKKLLNNNWYDTGDLGFFDKNNNLNLVGRGDDTFSVGHQKLCPEEVEYAVQKKITLKDFVITKKTHPILNWIPIGLAVKKKNTKINSEFIINKIKKDLSNYKIPRKIVFVKKIPRTNYGKLDRKQIQTIANKLYDKQ